MAFTRGALVFAAGCALAIVPGRSAAADKWLKVQTKDVLVYSDASRRDVTEFVVHYAAFRYAFNRLLTPAGRRAPPATIILFRRVDDFRNMVQSSHYHPENLVEFSGQVGSQALIALSVSGDRERALQLAFEFDTSLMLHRVGYFLPLWMSQGTGEVFASLELVDGRCEFGDSEALYAYPFENTPLIPWDEFFSVSNTSTAYKGRKDNFTGIYQAQSWGLMNAILLGGGSLRKRFETLAAKVNGTAGDQDAVAGVLGVKPDDLTRDLWHYKSRTEPIKLPFDAGAVRSSLAVAPAPEAEVKVRLSELLGISGQEAEAEQELDQAEALAPTAAYVKEARGYQAMRKGDNYSAALAFREAIAAGSTDGLAYLMSARQRLNDVSSGDRAGRGGPDATQALGEIRRCLQLAPGEAGAYRLLARTLFIAPDVSEADVAELKPALADPDDGVYVRFYLSLIYSRLGRPDACIAGLRQVLSDPRAAPGLKEDATNFLRRTLFDQDRAEVEKLIAAGKFPEARAVVARAALRPDGALGADAYGDLSRRIGDFEVRARALALYQQGKWRELRALANDYLQHNPHGGFAQSARGLRRMAREKLQPAPVPVAEASEPFSSTPNLSFLINRHWRGFDQYLSALGDQMQAAWSKAAGEGMRVPAGSKIKVSLYQTSDGAVAQIVRFEASPGVPDAVTQACIAAVRGGAPYDKWSDAMVVEMGERQFLVACFNF